MTCHHLPMPERVPATTTKVHSWGSRLFGLMVLPMGAGAVIMGMLERQDVAHGQDALPGVLALGSLAVLAGRALRLGISINDDELTTRGWLRTRRFRRSAITRVDGRGYSGFYNRSSSSRTFTMLVLTVDGREQDIQGVTGRATRTNERVSTLRDALGLTQDVRNPHLQRSHRRRGR
jgi:hypothetical protein